MSFSLTSPEITSSSFSLSDNHNDQKFDDEKKLTKDSSSLSTSKNNNSSDLSISKSEANCHVEIGVAEPGAEEERARVGIRYEILAGYKHSRFTLNMLLLIAAVCCWSFGALEGLGEKMEDNVSAPKCGDIDDPDCASTHFKGPFFQNFCMVLSESTGLLFFYLTNYLRKKGWLWIFDLPVTVETSTRKKCPWYLWYIPSIGDIGTMLCGSYSFLYIRTSTTSIIGNFIQIFMGVFAMWSRKKALRWSQWGATTLVAVGAILSSMEQVVDPDEETNTSSDMAVWGIFLAIASGVFQMYQMLVEEYLLNKYDVSAMEGIGIEGLVGISTSSVLLVIAHFAKWENVYADFYQVFHSLRLGGAVIMTTIAIGGNNFGGIHVTKLGSAVTRSVVGACKTPLIWTIEVIFGMNPFDWWSFGGVLCTLVGAFWYIDLLRFWCWPKLDRALHKPASCCYKLDAQDYNITVPDDSNEEWIDKRLRGSESTASTLSAAVSLKEESHIINESQGSAEP